MAKRPDDESDPRVVRTRRILHEALLELVNERDFDTLSVADVAERAQMNRATFYAHYRSLDELLDVALQMELDRLISAVTSAPGVLDGTSRDEAPEYIVETIKAIERRFPIYRRVFSANGSAKVVYGFLQRVAEEVSAKLRDGSLRSAWSVPPAVEAYAVAGAVIGILTYWLGAKPRPAVQRVAGWLWQLVDPMVSPATPKARTKR